MLKAISDSMEYLCKDTLGLKLSAGKSMGKDFYGSSIPLICDKEESHYYIFFKKDTLQVFGRTLMLMDELHEDDFQDLCKEIINLVIGKAKVTLNEENPKQHYKLGTPEYLGKISPPFPVKLEDTKIYKIKNRTFAIGVKKANG